MSKIFISHSEHQAPLRTTLGLLILLLLFTSCNEAQKYYSDLYNIPEVKMSDYRRQFATGDSMVIIGRLNPQNNLTVTVGGTLADYEVQGELKETYYPDGKMHYTKYDTIAFPITQAMGSGTLPVQLTSGGNTVDLPSIEIIPKPIHEEGFTMVPVTTLERWDGILNCQNGKGDLFVYREATKSIERILKDGTTQTILNLKNRSDEWGDWSAYRFNSGGVDPDLQNMWLSFQTRESDPRMRDYEVYRLLHYDIATGVITTLNRSIYPMQYAVRKRETILPYEGAIREVKLFKTGGIFPDGQGNIYLRLSNYATALLTEAANPSTAQLTYLFMTPPAHDSYSIAAWRPEVPNPAEMPGVPTQPTQGQLFDAANHLMYYLDVPYRTDELGMVRIWLYNLNSRAIVSKLEIASARYIPQFYSVGSFNFLTGIQTHGAGVRDTDLAGFLPLPGRKLLVLYYGNSYSLLDFNNRYAYPYTARVEIPEGYDLKRMRTGSSELEIEYRGDMGLNYDEEGMIYTTAERQRVILKTVKSSNTPKKQLIHGR